MSDSQNDNAKNDITDLQTVSATSSFTDYDASETSDSKDNILPNHIEFGIPERSKWTLDDWLDFYDRHGKSTKGYVDVYDDEDDDDGE